MALLVEVIRKFGGYALKTIVIRCLFPREQVNVTMAVLIVQGEELVRIIIY